MSPAKRRFLLLGLLLLWGCGPHAQAEEAPGPDAAGEEMTLGQVMNRMNGVARKLGPISIFHSENFTVQELREPYIWPARYESWAELIAQLQAQKARKVRAAPASTAPPPQVTDPVGSPPPITEGGACFHFDQDAQLVTIARPSDGFIMRPVHPGRKEGSICSIITQMVREHDGIGGCFAAGWAIMLNCIDRDCSIEVQPGQTFQQALALLVKRADRPIAISYLVNQTYAGEGVAIRLDTGRPREASR